MLDPVTIPPDSCPVCGSAPGAYARDVNNTVKCAANGDTWHYDVSGNQVVDTTSATLAIHSIMPNSGPAAGGQTVTITGQAFVAPMYVYIGGFCTSVTVVSGSELTAVTPAHAAGAQDVTISEHSDLSASVTLFGAYTYV